MSGKPGAVSFSADVTIARGSGPPYYSPTVCTREVKHICSRWTWASRLWSRPEPEDAILGASARRCSVAATGTNACSQDLKGVRRIFSHYDKLNVMFAALIHFTHDR